MSEKIYYKWTYEPTWIYLAGRLPSWHPNYRCWVNSNSYLSNYNIAEINSGGFKQETVFINVESNERVAEGLSVLIRQQVISKEYYNFLKELDEQMVSQGIFAIPPYNLKSNFKGIDNDKSVFGFFSVVHEQANRMYFSERDLSYFINNSTFFTCMSAIWPYPPSDPCDNCLDYSNGGDPTVVKPAWWSYP